MADSSSGSLLSNVMADLCMQERSILRILKKTEHLRRLRKWLKRSMKKIAPRLAPHVPDLDGDFEHNLVVVDIIITKLKILLRIENPATEQVKKFWKEFWESSDEEEEEEEYVSANEDFTSEEEQRNGEQRNGEEDPWEPIHSPLKKLVDAVTELKGSQLEDGELEEFLRDLKYLPELVDAYGELPVRMREANIHERNDARERMIIWPPMVILVNTKDYQDDNGKWIGMGDAKALEIFSLSKAVGSKSAYGPQGHRGMNILIFDASALGFMEAELLSKRFERSGIGREDWCRSDRVLICSDGKRKVHGYMANTSDIDIFNQYFIGETKLKAEIRSYQEMVVNPMKQMCEDYNTLHWYKNFMERVAKRKAHTEKFVKGLPWEVQENLKRSSKEDDQSRDREIVWPPMVIISNTELDEFANGMRLGMGDAEVLEYFEGYHAVRSQQSYGLEGHRGISALIFRDSAVGFMDAEYLSEDLEVIEVRDCSCIKNRLMRHTSGQRILYGQVAEERDMRKFNKHAQGESKLKFEMRSYQEMVLNPMKQMWGDFDIWKRYMTKVIKGNQHLEQSFAAVEITLCPNSHNIKFPPHSYSSNIRPACKSHQQHFTTDSRTNSRAQE